MIWAIGLGLLALVLWPFLAEALRRPVDAVVQAEAPGEFAVIDGKATHYRWHGPEGGPVVVLIHGLTTPSFVWDAIVPGLTALGFRVLRYDLWGRGYSDRLEAELAPDRYVDQLEGLLKAVGVSGMVSVIGYSMGARIAVDFAARDVNRVQHLCLVAPAGIAHRLSNGDRLARDWPGFGPWYCRGVGLAKLRGQIAAQADLSAVPEFGPRLLVEVKRRGYAPAILADYRDVLRDTDVAEHDLLHRAALPMAAVFGGMDVVIPIVAAETLADWNPDADITVIEDAGHGLPHTHPDAVVEAFERLTDDFL